MITCEYPFIFLSERKLGRCKSMDSKSNRLVAGSGVDSSRHTSFRRHGGGGFGGHDVDKEVVYKKHSYSYWNKSI